MCIQKHLKILKKCEWAKKWFQTKYAFHVKTCHMSFNLHNFPKHLFFRLNLIPLQLYNWLIFSQYWTWRRCQALGKLLIVVLLCHAKPSLPSPFRAYYTFAIKTYSQSKSLYYVRSVLSIHTVKCFGLNESILYYYTETVQTSKETCNL